MATRRLRNTLKELQETMDNSGPKELKVKFPKWLQLLKDKGYQQNNVIEAEDNPDAILCKHC